MWGFAPPIRKQAWTCLWGDWEGLPHAVAGISLNLARRYYEDYFQESYFTWDRKNYSSLALQNLYRARGMLGYTEQIVDAEEELRTACAV